MDTLPQELRMLIIDYLETSRVCRLSLTNTHWSSEAWRLVREFSVDAQHFHRIFGGSPAKKYDLYTYAKDKKDAAAKEGEEQDLAVLEWPQARQFDNLRALDVGWSAGGYRFGPHSLARVMHFPLVRLSIADAQAVDDNGMSYLARITTLHALSILGCRSVTSTGFISICTSLTNLRSLSFQSEPLEDSVAAQWLPNLSKLTNLDLFQCARIGDPTMQSIATSLKGLRDLDIGQCRGVTNSGIGALSALENLEYIYFSRGTGFTGATIGNLTSLRRLWLAYLPHLDNNGLATVSQLTYLQEFRVNDCSEVTDVGLKQALRPLTNLTSVHLECEPRAMAFNEPFAIFIAESVWFPKMSKLYVFGKSWTPAEFTEALDFLLHKHQPAEVLQHTDDELPEDDE